MKKEIEFICYDKNNGLRLIWDKDFAIAVATDGNEVIINANKAGLISLARHLITLAQDDVPDGSHFHFDEYNSLDAGSLDLIIQKN